MAALINGLTDYGLRPLAVKGRIEAPGSTFTFEEWNAFSRVIVHPTSTGRPKMWGPSPTMPWNRWRIDQKLMTIDGDAATIMYRFSEDKDDADFLKYDVTNLA